MRHGPDIHAPQAGTATRVRPDPLVPRPWTVTRVRHETADTITLHLRPDGPHEATDSAAALRVRSAGFQPGQFNMLYAFGVGESAISMSGDPGSPELVHTVRSVGSVTRRLHAARPGDTIGIRGPFGRGWPPAAPGGDLLVVAGGLGLAPLRPAVYRALADRAGPGRVVLVVGARSPADLLFRHELETWAARSDLDVRITVDAAGPAWPGPVGVVTRLLPDLPVDPDRTTALVCGPEIMMRHTARALEDRGIPAPAIHLSFERTMRCGLGTCGHCQLGAFLLCRDGPVIPYDRARHALEVQEL